MSDGATNFCKWLMFILISLWVVFGIILKVKGDKK